MCGIFGRWSSSPSSLESVLEALYTRGPDDSGEATWSVKGGYLQFVHTRLAIQDLTSAGHQPMQSSDGMCHIIFNGEIYNAPALRKELQNYGATFRSHSDTEVLIEGYGVWGDSLWQRLNGIFAIALLDRHLGQLVLVRDRFGVKPLLWHRRDSSVAFASSLAAFKAAGIPEKPRLDRSSLEDFWYLGSVSAPYTLVEEIESFPSGCFARWTIGNSSSSWDIHQYASLTSAQLTTQDVSYKEALHACRDALQTAVSRQLLSDVPVGAFLSGGLDSASLVSLMRLSTSTIPETFSLGFDLPEGLDKDTDELPLARLVAEANGTHHHEINISTEEAIDLFPEFCRAIDQPSADGFNTFLVSRAASRLGLRVALSGLGGDELFAGYPVFHRASTYMNSPHDWCSWQAHLPWRVQQRIGWQAARFKLGSANALSAHRNLHSNLFLRTLGPRTLSPSSLLNSSEKNLDLVAQLSRLEIRGYMADTLLRDSDSVSMYHSLELRVPFLDNSLVDLLLSLPSEYKVSSFMNKPLLIHSMSGDLPKEVVDSPKRGFELPFAPWLDAMPPPPIDPDALGSKWKHRVTSSRNRFLRTGRRYHGWWQWHVLSRWLNDWPELLAES